DSLSICLKSEIAVQNTVGPDKAGSDQHRSLGCKTAREIQRQESGTTPFPTASAPDPGFAQAPAPLRPSRAKGKAETGTFLCVILPPSRPAPRDPRPSRRPLEWPPPVSTPSPPPFPLPLILPAGSTLAER